MLLLQQLKKGPDKLLNVHVFFFEKKMLHHPSLLMKIEQEVL